MDTRIKEMLQSGDKEMIDLALATFHPFSTTCEEIEDINDKLEKNSRGYRTQIGIYREPQNIPMNIKEHVFYKRWNTGGADGGSCYDTGDEGATPYDGESEPNNEALEFLLKRWGKESMYNSIVGKFERNTNFSESHYYGNYDDYEVGYMLLSDVLNYLKNNP